MTVFQKIMFVLLGMIVAVAVFCVTVGIGCAVNGITFGEQIVEWFGKTKEIAKDVTDVTAMIKPII